MPENTLSFLWLQQRFFYLLVIAPPILIAVTFHEVAHGLAAYRLGDPTAKEQGRLTLNPFRHLDSLGTIFFVIFGFGWGKPVPVDGAYFESPRRDMALVSIAGPVSNFLLAALFWGLSVYLSPSGILEVFLDLAIRINIVLGVFNLIPIPPLDGSRLVAAILPRSMLKRYEALEGYGIALIFIAILYLRGGLWR